MIVAASILGVAFVLGIVVECIFSLKMLKTIMEATTDLMERIEDLNS